MIYMLHFVESFHVDIRTYSGPYFPTFGLNVSLRIQSECGKMRTRITPNSVTFYTVLDTYVSRLRH